MISCCSSEVDKNCTLLGYYPASSGNFLPTFRDNLTFPSSRIKNPKRKPVTLLGAVPAPAGTTLQRTYHRPHSSLYNKPRTRAPGLFYCLTLKMGPTGCPETSIIPRKMLQQFLRHGRASRTASVRVASVRNVIEGGQWPVV